MMILGARRRGFTLLEVLLALAVAGLMAAAALPFLLEALPRESSPEEPLRAAARQARLEALRQGEARRLWLAPGGFYTREGEPVAELPPGWTLEVRRPGDAKFRKPRSGESWLINGEGICEPLVLRLSGEGREVVASFDPLTALESLAEPGA